jgi:hypothetical protein
MTNSLRLPLAALALALVFAAAVALTGPAGGTLSELQIGLVAWAVSLGVFGLQGLLSVAVDGRELRPGRTSPRLTDVLSVAIAGSSVLLLAAAGLLAAGIGANMSVQTIGLAAGLGCLILAVQLVFYKEAFLGAEAALDRRDDGLPW